MTTKRDLRPILCALEKQGWDVVLRRSGYLKLTAPDGASYFTGSSPSDWRGIKNLIADLRRMGADL